MFSNRMITDQVSLVMAQRQSPLLLTKHGALATKDMMILGVVKIGRKRTDSDLPDRSHQGAITKMIRLRILLNTGTRSNLDLNPRRPNQEMIHSAKVRLQISASHE